MEPTISLERISELQSVDASNMLQSIRDFPDQLLSGWASMQQLTVPTHYIQATHVVIIGVGTSALAGQLVEQLAYQTSGVPINVCQSSQLPGYVSGKTLVIAVSYSGQTQETVQAFREAGERGSKLFGISTGGEIGALCRKYRAPWYQIQYGAQPRAAFGYLLSPLIETLQRLGFLAKPNILFEQSVQILRDYNQRLEVAVPSGQNPAKHLAQQLLGKQLYMIASDRCLPIAARWSAQLAQNAKHVGWYESIRQVEYATIERLQAFSTMESTLHVVNFRSSHDTQPDAIALNAVEQLLGVAKVPFQELLLAEEGSLLQDMLLFISLGDYVSYYLSLLKGIDPSPTPFREQLNERMGENHSLPYR